MPQMGVSVSEGTIVEWRKQPGDWVQYEEPICDISTDKIDTEVPAPASGRVTEVLVEVGATVSVGAVLARIATDARPGEAHASEARADERPQAEASAPEPAADAPQRPAPREPGARRRYSPVVTRMAAEHGIDLSAIRGTGRGGRVRKQDVLAHLANGGAGAPTAPEPPLHIESPYRPEPAPAPPAPGAPSTPTEAVGGGRPLSRMRRAIGEHMKRSLET